MKTEKVEKVTPVNLGCGYETEVEMSQVEANIKKVLKPRAPRKAAVKAAPRGTIKRVTVARLNRVISLPSGYERVTEGTVKVGDLVWWDGAAEARGWKPAELPVPVRNESSVGIEASLVFCAVRAKAGHSADGERLYKCGRCGSTHALSALVTVEGVDSLNRWCPDCVATWTHDCARCGAKSAASAKTLVYDGTVDRVDNRIGNGDSGAEGVAGAAWCPVCAAEAAWKCDSCGKHHTGNKTTVTTQDGSESWCKTCAVSKASPCARCGALAENGTHIRVDGNLWCADCARSHSTECSVCHRRVSAVYPRALDGVPVCNVCDPVPIPGRSVVLGYHGFGAPLKFWGGEQGKALFLGFELEAGGATETNKELAAVRVIAKSDNQRRFHLERDGSIPSHGFELISAPMTLAEHAGFAWEPLLKEMVRCGLRSHDIRDCGCGLHVHVSRDFLTDDDCANLDFFIQKNKKFWEFVARRPESSYAYFENKGAGAWGRQGGHGRYSALNFCHPGTVEFRLFRGTLRYKTLMATLEICDGVCRWIKTRDSAAILKNRGEIAGFVKWMKDRKDTYAEAREYILKTKAYIESTTTEPEL